MADNKSKTPFYLMDTQSAFYKPFRVRLAICISVVIWAAIEAWHFDPFWAVISTACAVYCVYVLFITYKPPVEAPARPADPEDDEADAAEGTDLPSPSIADEADKPKS